MIKTIKRVTAKDYEGISVITETFFYILFEVEKKRFFLLKDIWQGMSFPFSNKDIKEDGKVFAMFNGEEALLQGVPCIGTIFAYQECVCWDYKEVSAYGWSKRFYRNLVKSLYRKYEGFYGEDRNGKYFIINDHFILVNEIINIYSPHSEAWDDFMMQAKTRNEILEEMQEMQRYKLMQTDTERLPFTENALFTEDAPF
jgi:hypothetical protein